jgi:hypothetical protein
VGERTAATKSAPNPLSLNDQYFCLFGTMSYHRDRFQSSASEFMTLQVTETQIGIWEHQLIDFVAEYYWRRRSILILILLLIVLWLAFDRC